MLLSRPAAWVPENYESFNYGIRLYVIDFKGSIINTNPSL